MSAFVAAALLVAAAVDAGAEGVWAEEVLRTGDLAAPHIVLVEGLKVLELEPERDV